MGKDGKAQKYSKEQYLKWYEEMLLYRKFEDKASACYIQQKIRGFCHLYIGQEAIIAGYETVLGKDDSVITTYRDHCQPIGRGADPKIIMAELFGKTTGISRGRGGSMHMFDKEKHSYGGHGIVGNQIPMGAGIAFSEKCNNTGMFV